MPEVKKSALINDCKHISVYWKDSEQSGKSVGEQMWFVPNTVGGVRVGATPGKFGYFYSFELGNSIRST